MHNFLPSREQMLPRQIMEKQNNDKPRDSVTEQMKSDLEKMIEYLERLKEEENDE